MPNTFESDQTSLQHFGIKGMHWGVRRFENKNGTLTSAGRKRYDTDEDGDYKKIGNKTPAPKASSEGEPKKKSLSDKQKKMIIAGAAIAGTALAAYGGYKLHQLNTKATEGISKEFNRKAAANYRASSKLQVEGFNNHDQGFKIARESGADAGNRLMDLGKNYFDQASLHKDLADQYRFKANSKKYSVKEKYNYLKKGKVEDSALSKLTRNQINDAQIKRSGLKVLADDAVKKAQTSSKPAQNSSQTKPQSSVQKPKANQEANKKVTSDTLKIAGQAKFNQAAQANDDFVQELLKKNAKNLGL